jgi:excisionase family DNA binding protein
MIYYTIPEAAKILRISRIAVYKRVKSGKIKAIRVGRNYAIPAGALPQAPGKELRPQDKARLNEGIKRVIAEYSETLKLLGRE